MDAITKDVSLKPFSLNRKTLYPIKDWLMRKVSPNNKEVEKKSMDQRKKQNWKLMLEVDQKDAQL